MKTPIISNFFSYRVQKPFFTHVSSQMCRHYSRSLQSSYFQSKWIFEILVWIWQIDHFVFYPFVFIQLYLIWSFIVAHLAKAGVLKNSRNYENGEIRLKTPYILRPWIKATPLRAAKLKAAKLHDSTSSFKVRRKIL